MNSPKMSREDCCAIELKGLAGFAAVLKIEPLDEWFGVVEGFGFEGLLFGR